METGTRIFLESDDGREIDERLKLAARRLEVRALGFRMDELRDESRALDLLERATRAVARVMPGDVINPEAYIWKSVSRLVQREIECFRHEVPFTALMEAVLEHQGVAERMERDVIVHQILARMGPWLRRVWDLRLAYWRDEEIAWSIGMNVRSLQERLSRETKDFREHLHHQHKRR